MILYPADGALPCSRSSAAPSEELARLVGAFNEMIGPGTCTRPRRATRFFTFVNPLVQTQDAPEWRTVPLSFKAQFGDVISARNDGLEVQGYPPVAVFGGGLDPTLNQLSGNPIPAPECFLLGDADFALPGQSSVHDANVLGTMNFQCCIHPWMRATATVN